MLKHSACGPRMKCLRTFYVSLSAEILSVKNALFDWVGADHRGPAGELRHAEHSVARPDEMSYRTHLTGLTFYRSALLYSVYAWYKSHVGPRVGLSCTKKLRTRRTSHLGTVHQIELNCCCIYHIESYNHALKPSNSQLRVSSPTSSSVRESMGVHGLDQKARRCSVLSTSLTSPGSPLHVHEVEHSMMTLERIFCCKQVGPSSLHR